MTFQAGTNIMQAAIPIVYWVCCCGRADHNPFYPHSRSRKSYEEPMQQLAEAAGKVAEGDFSVYVAPHSHSGTGWIIWIT